MTISQVTETQTAYVMAGFSVQWSQQITSPRPSGLTEELFIDYKKNPIYSTIIWFF